MKTKRVPIRICLLFATLMPAVSTLATTRVVTSLNDSGAGTLRDTIAASTAGDTIVFTTNGTITLTTGELLVGRNLTITGSGATNLTVHGSSTNRVFEIATNVAVNISGLTIAAGNAVGTNGGLDDSLFAFPGGTGLGGGILNRGTLSLDDCLLSNNGAKGGAGGTGSQEGDGGAGGSAAGGGIFNYGNLGLTACAFSGNQAVGGTGGEANGGVDSAAGNGGVAQGAGVANQGVLTATNCTFAGNTVTGGDAGFSEFVGYGGAGAGGAIWSGGSSVVMVNCTVTLNAVSGGNGAESIGNPTFGGNASGGGLALTAGGLTLRNVIVAADTVTAGRGETYDSGNGTFSYNVNGTAAGPDVSGAATSQGHNLIGEANGSSGWVGSDLTGTITSPLNAQLGPLQNNGGPTPTLALLATSPAIDAGDDAVLSAPYNLTTDQRGLPRFNGLHVDIGAFEFGGTELVTSLADNGLGTLRQAIASAAPGDRITFSPQVTGTIALTNGELLIGGLLNIVGPGATILTISGNHSNRVFHVSPSGTLNLYGLTIANGSVTGASGATGTGGANGYGGGMFDEGTANLTDCILISNTAAGGTGGTGFNATGPGGYGATGGAGAGGGIYNASLLSLLRCTLAGNSALGGTGGIGGSPLNGEPGGTGGAAFGAGIANAGILTLTNCTLAENSALAGMGGAGGPSQEGPFPGTGGMGGSAHGAGLSADAGSVILTSCTISSNLSLFGNGSGSSGFFGSGTLGPGSANSGGLFAAGNAQVQNCLIAGNQATNYPDVDGTVQSGGFNLVGDADGSTGWLGAEGANIGNGSLPINPRLGPLQNNGGSTPTMALLGGSPAIDQGNSFGLTTDQRGFVRPSDNPSVANASGGDGSDIGAFEVAVLLATPARLSLAGYRNNHFQFLLTGQSGSNYVIQAATSLATPAWLSIYTNTSPFTFVDSNAGTFSRRFYRGEVTP